MSTDGTDEIVVLRRNQAASVWRVPNVTDCREAGDLVLIARGEDRLWIEADLAVIVGAVGHRIRDRHRLQAVQDDWFQWTVGREAWIAAALIAVSFVAALAAMGVL